MHEKLKSFLADDALFYTVLIVVVAVVSFGLGKHTLHIENSLKNNNISNNVALVPLSPVVATEKTNTALTVSNIVVVASKSGTKYHLPSCPGAQQIKAENRIEFPSIEAAKSAGYSPAANCPGI